MEKSSLRLEAAISNGFSSFFLKKLLYMGMVWFSPPREDSGTASPLYISVPAALSGLATVVELAAASYASVV